MESVRSCNKLANVVSNAQAEKASQFQPKAGACLKADSSLRFRKNQMLSVLTAVAWIEFPGPSWDVDGTIT